MNSLVHHKMIVLIAACTFAVCGFVSILLHTAWPMLLPFAVLLLPLAYKLLVTHPQQLYWSILFLLPLSTEINLTPSLGLDFPVEILLMLLTGLFLVKLLLQPAFFPLQLVKQPLFALLVLHFVWIFITCLFSVNPLLSLKFWLAKIWYIIPFVLLTQHLITSPKNIIKTGKLLLWPMAFTVMVILIRHANDGFTFEGIKDIMQPFFRNHVNYSAMLVTLLPAAVMSYHFSKGREKKLILIGLVIAIAALFFAYSRGAWLALIIGLFTYWLIKKRLLQPVLILGTIVILIFTAWLITNNNYLKFAPDYESTIFHNDFKQHLAATTSLKDVSNAERFYRWVAGFNMVADKPVFGFGPNNFYDYYKPYAEGIFKTYVSDNPEHSSVHNYYLLTALEQGVPGLIIFTALVFGMLLTCQRLYHQFKDSFYRNLSLVVGVSIAMIATLNGMSDLIETDKIGGLFWLSLGLIFVLLEKRKSEETMLA